MNKFLRVSFDTDEDARLSHKKLIDIWCTIESINPAINE